MRNKMKNIILFVLLVATLFSQNIDFVGNSITANGYPEIVDFWMVQDDYEWRAFNYGVPGITVSITGYDYINTESYKEVMARKSDHIVVMLGSNDRQNVVANGVWGFNQSYRLLIFNLMSVSKKVFLGTVTYPIYSGENDVIDKINEVIRQTAQDYGLSIIDFNSELGTNPDYFQADGVHPTKEGKHKLARLAFNVLKEYPIYLGIEDEYWESVERYEKEQRIGWFGCQK